jgi:sugar (pentulose or hexulose) kinase
MPIIDDEAILSIDCGTQSLRALVFNLSGLLLESVKIAYEPYLHPHPGWAEQDPEIYWNSLIAACRQLKEKNTRLWGRITGVGVTTQRATMINVDRRGVPLRPAITWLDQRKAEDKVPFKSIFYPFLKIGGKDRILSRIYRDGKCNWIRQYQPRIWEKTHKYLQVSGFLNYRLTGEYTDSVASQIGYIPFNYRKLTWCKPYELPAILFPVEKEKLPRLAVPGEVIGAISADAARFTGLKKGIPIVACGSDKGCETLGMGVVAKHMASLGFGTTATVQITSASYFEVLPMMPPYPAAVAGHYNPEIEIFRGYWMITWFKKAFAGKEVETALKNGIIPEVALDQLLAQSQPGAMGLVVQPYWGPGLNHPEAKGAMIGFGDVHTKAHVYRAVIEGLAFALLEGVRLIEKKGRVSIEKLAVSGGASQSDQICQISADIFNRLLLRGKTTETSGLGAAILTAYGLGYYPCMQTAMNHMVSYDKQFEPVRERADLYTELFEKVYLKLYTALSPLYRHIRDITGYPEL